MERSLLYEWKKQETKEKENRDEIRDERTRYGMKLEENISFQFSYHILRHPVDIFHGGKGCDLVFIVARVGNAF